MKKSSLMLYVLSVMVLSLGTVFAQTINKDVIKWDNSTQPETLNKKADGYRGIWYYNQKLDNEYVYKYSGGLGTYCAKHRPFAVYCKEVDKTFFCYGGRKKEENTLIHMVSFYDHKTGKVPKPTILVDKETTDAHDNPVISVDDEGYIWIFSSSHGTGRPSYIHRSKKPYDIEEFVWILTTNFSYTQPWYLKNKGFLFFHTVYGFVEGVSRTSCFMKSADGINWTEPQAIAAIELGHYQISEANESKAGVAFNMHPRPKGLNWRTNLYYMETLDAGETWQTVDGKVLQTPVTAVKNPALIHDYQAEGLNVYLKDIAFDSENHPVLLYITSKGFESGPQNDPRTWTTARWNGEEWIIRKGMRSDNNYDMGSLYVYENSWRIIGPTETGPQPYNPGGEMALWISHDQGKTWSMERQLTQNSERNHTYARRPVNAHDDFYAIWADGHGRQPSKSVLYFSDKSGEHVYQLPEKMQSDMESPIKVNEPQ